MIEGAEKFDVAQSCALQTDLGSHPARKLLKLLRPLTAEGAAGKALALLRGWDAVLEAASSPCALYQVWWMRHLRVAVLERLAPDPKVRALLQPGDMSSLIEALEHPDARFGADPIADRDAMLAASLAAAWGETCGLLGADPARWAWGDCTGCVSITRSERSTRNSARGAAACLRAAMRPTPC